MASWEPARSTGQGRRGAPGEIDRYLFNEGRHHRLYDVLGAHPLDEQATTWSFALWAPAARAVSVIHDRNGWRAGVDRLEPQETSGIWHGIVSGLSEGDRYKYAIEGPKGLREKADPVAFAGEVPPRTASVLCRLDYAWADAAWMGQRHLAQSLSAPIAIYEVHLGSWRRHEDGTLLSYDEIADPLLDHVHAMGFTHVELMPVMEHPFYGSWGYQTTGYFSPSARQGPPQALMSLIDTLHQGGIGVILDWVPSHFATDDYALGELDGTHLYEHAAPSRAFHPDWGSYEFNYGRHEVRSFLVSSACFWLDRYHADGLRVDGVASMLYLDYSRGPGEWEPNEQGGREDLDAIAFLREMNDAAHAMAPGALTIAEESTAWPGVTKPTGQGGLGFSLKWDMGWMHDTLTHLRRDPIHRRFHYDELTFRSLYATSEAFVLALSHDEVVHGKGSLAAKMPGDDWQKRANLRLLLGYQWLLPGKKLLFMGGELGTWREWDHDGQLEWDLLEHPAHAGIARFVADCNRCYRDVPALHVGDASAEGFAWVESRAPEEGIYAFVRLAAEQAPVLAVCNLTPVPRRWRLGVPEGGRWIEILNSDAVEYGGSGIGNEGAADAAIVPLGHYPATLELTCPPLAVLALTPRRGLP
jgi:1,4-alpha-glucan branching enzyme